LNAPQFIKTPSGEELVVLSRADYDALTALAAEAEEDAADIAAYDAAIAALSAGTDAALPAPVSDAIHKGANRLRTIRQFARFTQAEVAERADISQSYLSALEAGARALNDDVAHRLARALDVPLAWVAPR
jgi:DNA-binding XRE family transcriptional regulator